MMIDNNIIIVMAWWWWIFLKTCERSCIHRTPEQIPHRLQDVLRAADIRLRLKPSLSVLCKEKKTLVYSQQSKIKYDK